MMERICRQCGRVYRGLVCHECHPRQNTRTKMRCSSDANTKAQQPEEEIEPIVDETKRDDSDGKG